MHKNNMFLENFQGCWFTLVVQICYSLKELHELQLQLYNITATATINTTTTISIPDQNNGMQ